MNPLEYIQMLLASQFKHGFFFVEELRENCFEIYDRRDPVSFVVSLALIEGYGWAVKSLRSEFQQPHPEPWLFAFERISKILFEQDEMIMHLRSPG